MSFVLHSLCKHVMSKQRRINVGATLCRDDVTSTLVRRCFDVMYLLGVMLIIGDDKLVESQP